MASIWIAHWYRKNVGTPYELAPLPQLYQKYAGHDNNRDWFMMNLAGDPQCLAHAVREWFPQIVYNQHQAARVSGAHLRAALCRAAEPQHSAPR